MKHPTSGAKLEWTRVADFYHVSERVWAMADAFDKVVALVESPREPTEALRRLMAGEPVDES